MNDGGRFEVDGKMEHRGIHGVSVGIVDWESSRFKLLLVFDELEIFDML